MLKNESLRSEVKGIVAGSGVRLIDIANTLGVKPQSIISIYKKKMLDGNEGWIKVLDACGYDVEVKIKKKKEQ